MLTDTLVDAAAELLNHLAMHNVLAFETSESYERIKPRQVSTAGTNSNDDLPDRIVTIDLPPHLVPYGAILESMKAWNIGTVETVADLSVLANLWARSMNSEGTQRANLSEEWYLRACEISPKCVASIEKLDAACLLHVTDSRTGGTYVIDRVKLNDSVFDLEITTKAELPASRNHSKTLRKKTAKTRK